MRVSKVIVSVCVLVAVCAGGAQAGVVTFDWATVGNAGNAADPLNSTFVPGIGSVGYEYRIATTEVTNAQYAVFLNTVDAAGTNPNAVYDNNMGSNVRGGISFSAGAANGSKYATKPNMGNKPVNYVSFWDSMRFVNWLENGQTAGGTESGVYAIASGLSAPRAANAQYFIPSENEWYKAAYHQPAAQGGDADNYWLYPTASNSIPVIASATAIGDIANPGAGGANYSFGADWNGQNGNVTTVASAGPLSASFYGTFDQGGNLWEWNEMWFGSFRGLRGGSWGSFETSLRSSSRGGGNPEDVFIGFRVASAVPEPGCLALLALGASVMLRRRTG
jgi:formylglycine-generating enzyme required for sulfatase activity